LTHQADKLSEKCAVAGVWGDENAVRLTVTMLEALQHRGQDATGVVARDDRGAMLRHVQLGLVASAYPDTVLDAVRGKVAIGHNRYATSSGASDFEHIQPFADARTNWALAHNGNLSVVEPLVDFLVSKNIPGVDLLNDSGMMHAAVSHYLQAGSGVAEAIAQVFPILTGAFSCVAMHEGKLVAFRDACGIRPLSYGKLPSGGYVVASETRALDAIGATEQKDIAPGQVVVIDEAGVSKWQVATSDPKLDIFEVVYFARGDSRLYGRVVEDIRYDFGAQLAREQPLCGDTANTIVVPVPRSAISAAEGFAKESGLPYAEGIMRSNRLRTFIKPDQDARKRAVREKLLPDPTILRGKRVVLIEDSIVRGTTLGVLIEMLREAGAAEVHVRISSPPVRFPNFYGINMPSQAELVAYGRTVEQVSELIGADSLGYLSVDGMLAATRRDPKMFDTSVFTGEYPIDIGVHQEKITVHEVAVHQPRAKIADI
jgi:amidophosphoribosyltransferase